MSYVNKLHLSDNNEAIFFSIITVTYNAEKSIRSTLDSISQQDKELFELIVIDGASTDRTISIVDMHFQEVDMLISSPDKGIYDAMNKGISLANGEYIIFMNAGDCFYDKDTLLSVHKFLSKNPVDLYAGSAKVVYNCGAVKEKKAELIRDNCFYTPVCHQSLYAKATLMKSMLFDCVNFKYAADFDFMMKVINCGGTSFVTDSPLSIVTAEGVSDIARIKVWREYKSIFSKYNKLTLFHRLYYKRQISIQYIKKILTTFKKYFGL